MPIPSRGQLGQMANPQFSDPRQNQNLGGFPAGAKPKPGLMPGQPFPMQPGQLDALRRNLPPPQPGMPGMFRPLEQLTQRTPGMGGIAQIPPGMPRPQPGMGGQYGGAQDAIFGRPQPMPMGPPITQFPGQPGQKPMQPMPGTLTAAGQPQPWQPYAGQPPQAGPSRVPPGMPQGPPQKPQPGMPNLGAAAPGRLGGGK